MSGKGLFCCLNGFGKVTVKTHPEECEGLEAAGTAAELA